MATTAAGTPYVESSDLVANYPGVSLALANHIDTLGKVLQVVRATDTTRRSTTSATFVDASISVTITPQKSDSAIIIIGSFSVNFAAGGGVSIQITDSSNNAISGAERMNAQNTSATDSNQTYNLTAFGYNTPATILPVTYKTRFRRDVTGTGQLMNDQNTGQMYAIEVAA